MTACVRAKTLGAILIAAVLAWGGSALAQGSSLGDGVNDFPTEARADYVFACMATNGQTQEALRRCSCSVDVIASILTYDQYVEADTVLRMRLVAGEKSTLFKTGRGAKQMVETLRRAQAEAEIRCF